MMPQRLVSGGWASARWPVQRSARVVTELTKLTSEEFRQFRDFIYRRTGIAMQEGKITLLSNRIRRRLRELRIVSFDEYYRLLSTARLPGELEHFVDAITTNETQFFRTITHFEWFGGPFIDEVASRAATGGHQRSIRVWSAACSSGEEPYSLAMCLAEARSRLSGWRCSVLGTDISETMLAKARAARFGERSLELVSPARRTQHFMPGEDGEWIVRPAVASLCEFRRHNLLEPMREPPFDCIFIRNVLIYFDRESKRTAVRTVVESLAAGGYLVVGPADGIYDMLGDLRRHSTFLYQKP
jgi:chemotaxis protein methyltransferase CheR